MAASTHHVGYPSLVGGFAVRAAVIAVFILRAIADFVLAGVFRFHAFLPPVGEAGASDGPLHSSRCTPPAGAVFVRAAVARNVR